MASFAVNRKNANKGTGLKPGVWFFEEFQFQDSVFGAAKVEYVCESRKLTPSEIPEGDCSRPYILEITEPFVTELKVFDDDGTEIEFGGEEKEILSRQVLDAFEAIEDDVMSFEIGLL